jgi:hypothetical protein
MNRRYAHRFFAAAALLPLAAVVVTGTTRPVHAALVRAEEGYEAATTSKLTGVGLPAGANRVTDKAYVEQAAGQLRQVAAKLDQGAYAPEVLAWEGGPDKATALRKDMAARLTRAGYKVQEWDGGSDGAGGTLTVLLANRAESVGSVKSVLGVWVAGPEATLLTWCSLGAKSGGAGKVLVDGATPLMQGTVDAFDALGRWFVGDAGAKTSPSFRETLVGIWRSGDEAAIGSVLSLLRDEANLREHAPKGEGVQRLFREYLRRDILAQAAAGDSSPAAKALADAYAAANPPVAGGEPPLTRATRDAYVELADAVFSAVPNGTRLTAAEQAALAEWVTRRYAELPADEKRAMAELPVTVATFKAVWPTLSAAERQELTAKMPAGWRTAAAALRKARTEDAAATATTAADDAPVLRGSRTAAQIEQDSPRNAAQVQARIAANSRRFTILSNAMTDMHVTRMNAWAALGGSPYRWEVRRW